MIGLLRIQGRLQLFIGLNCLKRPALTCYSHDFMGKSTGAGSLSIWTHHFKEIEIIDSYSDPSTTYNGSAVTLGSGWQTASIYNALDVVGKVIVGGECAV